MTLLVPPVQAGLWLTAQQLAARVGGRPGRPGRLATAVGVSCIGAGAAAGVQSLAAFTRRRTTWHPWAPERSTALVTGGANAVSRNPMYLGMALGLVGTGLLSGRPWTCLAAGGLMTTLTPQVRREEAALASIFGSEWETYAARVRRWV